MKTSFLKLFFAVYGVAVVGMDAADQSFSDSEGGNKPKRDSAGASNEAQRPNKRFRIFEEEIEKFLGAAERGGKETLKAAEPLTERLEALTERLEALKEAHLKAGRNAAQQAATPAKDAAEQAQKRGDAEARDARTPAIAEKAKAERLAEQQEEEEERQLGRLVMHRGSN